MTKKRVINIILTIMFFAGLSLILYPTVSDWWNSMHQSRAVASYIKQVADLSGEEKERMYQEAVAYNEKIAGTNPIYNLTDEETEEYNKVLDVTGTGIMGYVEISKLDVKLPIYHGVDDAVLQIAIGHLPGTSLPVGGEGTHCVLSGHRGLPSAKLFTDLDQMVVGDRFILTVLDRTMTYEVDQIRIVLPSELEDLKIEDGEDYCTLFTCTPYGINTHRLLVRGHRVPNAADDAHVTADALQVDTKLVALILIPFILFMWVLFYGETGRQNRIRREILAREQERQRNLGNKAGRLQKEELKGKKGIAGVIDKLGDTVRGILPAGTFASKKKHSPGRKRRKPSARKKSKTSSSPNKGNNRKDINKNIDKNRNKRKADTTGHKRSRGGKHSS